MSEKRWQREITWSTINSKLMTLVCTERCANAPKEGHLSSLAARRRLLRVSRICDTLKLHPSKNHHQNNSLSYIGPHSTHHSTQLVHTSLSCRGLNRGIWGSGHNGALAPDRSDRPACRSPRLPIIEALHDSDP